MATVGEKPPPPSESTASTVAYPPENTWITQAGSCGVSLVEVVDGATVVIVVSSTVPLAHPAISKPSTMIVNAARVIEPSPARFAHVE